MDDWQNHPHDLLTKIATKLNSISANIRFAGACRSWRRAALEDRHRLMRIQQIPGLILPRGRQENPCGTRKFIAFTEIINHQNKKKNDDNDHSYQTTLLLPWRLAERSLCIGWFRGWMLILDYDTKLRLLNPITGSEFALPEYYFRQENRNSINHMEFLLWGFRRSRRVSIWAPPGGHSVPVSDWRVFVVLPTENFLTYCRVGDGVWGVLEFPEYRIPNPYVVDALCSMEEGYLYVLITTGELFCCDLWGETKNKRTVASGNTGIAFNSLVEVEGEILMVHGNREGQLVGGNFSSRTSGFDVYKLDREGKQWAEITELGEFAVFLWFGQPFSVRAELELGIKGNCVYFLEMEESDECDGKVRCDIGVFDLKSSKMEFFHVGSEFEKPCVGKPVRLPVPIAPVPW